MLIENKQNLKRGGKIQKIYIFEIMIKYKKGEDFDNK